MDIERMRTYSSRWTFTGMLEPGNSSKTKRGHVTRGQRTSPSSGKKELEIQSKGKDAAQEVLRKLLQSPGFLILIRLLAGILYFLARSPGSSRILEKDEATQTGDKTEKR
jgi:hypothetical protein